MGPARVAAVAIASLVIVASCAPATEAPASTQPGAGIVTRVVDGDTVTVLIGGAEHRVRLIGVDTPEVAHPPEPAECFGPEASAFVQDLLPPGTRVQLTRDQEPRDAYDRLLAYVVRTSDDLDINLVLLEQGYASTLSIAPNTTHAITFARAEADARAAERGLWGAC